MKTKKKNDDEYQTTILKYQPLILVEQLSNWALTGKSRKLTYHHCIHLSAPDIHYMLRRHAISQFICS